MPSKCCAIFTRKIRACFSEEQPQTCRRGHVGVGVGVREHVHVCVRARVWHGAGFSKETGWWFCHEMTSGYLCVIAPLKDAKTSSEDGSYSSCQHLSTVNFSATDLWTTEFLISSFAASKQNCVLKDVFHNTLTPSWLKPLCIIQKVISWNRTKVNETTGNQEVVVSPKRRRIDFGPTRAFLGILV